MRFVALVLAFVASSAVWAADPEPPKFEEGKHYTVLKNRPKPPAKGPIEVTEMFWYGCGHCYDFEPMLNQWATKLGDDVKFTRSPAIWRGPMRTHAQLYYTAQALGQLDKLHHLFFEAMHKQNKQLVDTAEIQSTVSGAGVDGTAFVQTMDSFAVNSQVTQADKRQRAYNVSGTPELVVGGYYHISTATAGGQKGMLQVADYLIEKIRSERQ